MDTDKIILMGRASSGICGVSNVYILLRGYLDAVAKRLPQGWRHPLKRNKWHVVINSWYDNYYNRKSYEIPVRFVTVKIGDKKLL